jgi:hypothetical protein
LDFVALIISEKLAKKKENPLVGFLFCGKMSFSSKTQENPYMGFFEHQG